MGVETAIIASAVIGAGASAYSSKRQKDEAKGARKEAEKIQEEEKAAQAVEAENQKKAKKDYYTNLRRGNINLLNPTEDQTLG